MEGQATGAGFTDAHFHTFGPETTYPVAANVTYAPPPASPESYRALARQLAISRAVIVQASAYGFDNSRQLDAIGEIGIPIRAIVVVPPEIPDLALEDLHKRGARGIRFIATRPGGLPLSNLETMAARAAEIGWHVQLMFDSALLVENEKRLTKLACPIVIDHLAQPDVRKGVGQPAFQALLRLLDTGRCWTKASAPYHMHATAPAYAEFRPFVEKLLEKHSDRIMWASDWPHAATERPTPKAADFINALRSWIPDPAILAQIMNSNAVKFYGFA